MTKAWAENKDTILGYYQARKLPLNQVILIMKAKHNFNASQRAYRQQFRLWGVFKYNRKDNQIHATKTESKDAVTAMPPYPSVYYSRPAKGLRNTPRAAHAQTVRPETMHSIPPMISPYAIMPSPYPSPVPTPSSSFHDDSSMGHIRGQYPYHHDTHHASSRDIKSQISEIILDGSVAQVGSARESASSLRLPAVDNSTVTKTPQPQNPGHRSPSAYSWDYNGRNGNIDLGHSDQKSSPEQGPGSPHDSRASQALHTSHSPYQYPSVKSLTHPSPPFGDYSSEQQHDVKPYYGAHHHYEQDTKPRPWPSTETLPVTSAPGYETHRYHLLPSPAHSQEHSLSPRGTKALEEHIATPRTLPPSPSSLPEIVSQASLNRETTDMQAQGHAYEYNPSPMPTTLSMVRPYDTAYATSGGPPDHHSVCGIATSVYA